MQKLEMFFDYACPYCLEGYGMLSELAAEDELVSLEHVEWLPCEAHPRPEKWDRYSDLCAMGMYIAQDMGVDINTFHTAMYKAALTDRASVNIEDIDSLAQAVSHILDKDAFAQALQKATHAERVYANNQACWNELGFLAVPSFRIGNATLSAVWHEGITKQSLLKFIKDNNE